MDQDSHSYYLIKQSETILTQLREQARKIQTAQQKISTNLKNIRSGHNQLKPLQPQQTSIYSNTSLSQHSHHMHPSFQQNYSKQDSQNLNPINSINISKSLRFCEQMNDIQEYSEQDSQQYPIERSFKESSHSTIKAEPNIEISFANSNIKHQLSIPQSKILFIPFNKLYKSPILQLKDKNRLILARKYKGCNIKINDGKICDGKIYKFSRIVTDEDELLQELINSSSIGLIGSYGTLKKKIHMCLFIKYYQQLMQHIEESADLKSNIVVEYIQVINKSVTIHIYQQFVFNRSTRRSQVSRISNIFESILESMIDKDKEKEKTRPYHDKEKIKSKTRIIRILDREREEKFQVVSSSNQSMELFEEHRFKKVVWCINPLVKHYEMTQQTLQFAKRIQQAEKLR